MSTDAASLPTWTDRKKGLWTLGLVAPAIPLIAWALVEASGSGLFWWFGPVFFYVLIPILDYLVGEDESNPPEELVGQIESRRYYRWLVMLAIPIQFASVTFGSWMAVNGGLAWFEWLGLLLTTGLVSGISINTAHELGHKTDNLARWAAKLSLAPVAYGHFFVEHNRGHHVRVATPEDPASSRMGESFWAFLPRTVLGSLKSAWALEKARLQRRGLSVWHWRNENLQAWSLSLLFFAALSLWLGWQALPFLLLQALYGASLLEVVNYLEHYGLVRQKLADGRYERVQPRHSWNSNSIVANLFLYQLQRHSDHHANPTRSYQALRHFDEGPQLPAGYGALVPIVYFPFLWYRLMDHRVCAHYGGDLRKANLDPHKRAALLERFSR